MSRPKHTRKPDQPRPPKLYSLRQTRPWPCAVSAGDRSPSSASAVTKLQQVAKIKSITTRRFVAMPLRC
jgi:hypothetical protein